MPILVARNVARKVGLRITLLADGKPNTATSCKALMIARSPGGTNDGKAWRDDTQAWTTLPVAYANRPALTHEENGSWYVTVPAAALAAAALNYGDTVEISAADTDTEGSVSVASDVVDLQIVPAFMAAGSGGHYTHTIQVRASGDPVSGVTVLLYDSTNTYFVGTAGTTTGSGDIALVLPAATYTARAVSPSGGWTASATTATVTVSSDGQTTSITGTNTSASSPLAGRVNVSFHVGNAAGNRSGVEITVNHVRGWAPISGTPDTTASNADSSGTTDASGNLTLQVLSGVPFSVDCDEIGESGQRQYRATSAVDFAVLQKAWRGN